MRTLARWLSTVIGSPRLCRALPPSATTTRMRRSPAARDPTPFPARAWRSLCQPRPAGWRRPRGRPARRPAGSATSSRVSPCGPTTCTAGRARRRAAPRPATSPAGGPRRPGAAPRPASAPWSGRTRRPRRWRRRSPSGSRVPATARAASGRVLAPSRRAAERREVVLARAAAAAASSQAVDVQRPRRCQQHLVPAQRVRAGRVGRRRGRRSDATAPRSARRSPAGATAAATQPHVVGAAAPPARGRGVRPPRAQRRGGHVDVGDLAAGVHAGVGASGHRQPRRRGQAQHQAPARPRASACTVRSPGWTAQPAKSVPS